MNCKIEFINVIRKYRSIIVFFVTIALFSKISSMILPYLLGSLIDVLTVTAKTEKFYEKLTAIILVSILQILLMIALKYTSSMLQTKVSLEINKKILDRILNQPVEKSLSYDYSYLNQRISTDSGVVTSFMFDSVLNAIINVITLIVVLAISFKINKFVFIIILLSIPIYMLVFNKLKQPLYIMNLGLKESKNKLFSKMYQVLNNILLVKINSLISESMNEIQDSIHNLVKDLKKQLKVSIIFNNFSTIFMLICNTILISVCGVAIINGSMTVGEFTIVTAYFSMSFGALNSLLNFGEVLQQTKVSYNRIEEIVKIEAEKNGIFKVVKVDNIIIDGVSIDIGGRFVKFPTMSFDRGNIYCLKGENGTGKSTLLYLLCGIYSDYYGEIFINDCNIMQVDRYELRRNNISFCQQEPRLIKDNISTNFTVGNTNVNDLQLELLIDRMNFRGVFEMPERKISNDSNSLLSGGEKQKIQIIRTLYKNTDVLIFDEPTSALDSSTSESFISLLNEIRKDKIIIIASHDEKFIEISDIVFEL